jgi:hypothetical protein
MTMTLTNSHNDVTISACFFDEDHTRVEDSEGHILVITNSEWKLRLGFLLEIGWTEA